MEDTSSYILPTPSATPVQVVPLEEWEKVPVSIHLQCHHPWRKGGSTTTIDFPKIETNVAATRTLWRAYDAIYNCKQGQELIMNYLIDMPYHFDAVMVKFLPDPRNEGSWKTFEGEELLFPVAVIWTKEIVEAYQAANAEDTNYGNPVIKVLVQKDRVEEAKWILRGSTAWYLD